MAFPSLVPEAVVVAAIAVEADMEPVFVGGIPFLLLYVFKCQETASNKVK